MITRENIYENREYITQINRTRIFFTFPDGKQEHADNPPAETVKDLLAYFTEEWQFYARTVDLLRNEYDKRKAALDRKKKFYTVEEIEKADLFDSASMKVHNLEIITEEEFYRAKRERDRRRRKENSPVYGVLFCLLALGTPFLMVMMWLCGIG